MSPDPIPSPSAQIRPDAPAEGADRAAPAPEGTQAAGSATRRITITPEAAGQRLDRALAAALADQSRSRLQALIAEGCVAIDGRTVTDPAAKVRAGSTVALSIPAPAPARPRPQPIALTIIYEDPALLVVDKPAGLVVHPAAGNPDGTLVNALLAHCAGQLSGIGGVARPGIVHRLDKDTSGLMVVAKTDAAHRALAAQFADRSLSRDYLAVVQGVPTPHAGEIEGAIGRDPRDRKRMAVLAQGGKPALTRYRVRAVDGTVAALVECRLATGRTHQIRVHMASIGHPLIGDTLYNRRRGAELPAFARSFPRQALHAGRLRLRHPTTGDEHVFTSPLPPDMRTLIVELFGETGIPD